MNSRSGCGHGGRLVVYLWWGLSTAVSIAYAALAITNAQHMSNTRLYGDNVSYGNSQKKAVIVACALGAAMVLVNCVISLILLLRNMVSGTAVAAFWYGVLIASSLHVSIFMLLSSAVLTIFKYEIDYWERDDQDTFPSKWVNVYKVTFGLSFVLVATYLVQVFVFWFWRKAFVEEQASHAGNTRLPALQQASTGSKASKRSQAAIEFEQSLQSRYNHMVV